MELSFQRWGRLKRTGSEREGEFSLGCVKMRRSLDIFTEMSVKDLVIEKVKT